MRSARSHRAVAAVTAAGLLALAGPVWPAAAEPPTASNPAGPESGSGGKPQPQGRPPEGDPLRGIPPLQPKAGPPANEKPKPDLKYTKKKNCVQTLDASARKVERKPWGQIALNFEDAWRFTKGAGVRVAVIDTGVNRHPRLGNRVEAGGDYVVEKEDGLTDCEGHGTAVAGIIAADDKDPSVGFAGVAPEATIVTYRQADPSYEGEENGAKRNAGNVETMARAIVHAVDSAKVKVINISESACEPPGPGAYYPRLHAAVRYAIEHDVVVVAAAGNTNENKGCKQNEPYGQINSLPSPAWFDDEVLTVGAVQEDGSAANFSVAGPWVDVAGPGTEITTLDPARNGTGLANKLANERNELTSIQGTSFAAPYVAGVVALVRARYPHLNAKQVIHRIEKTSQHPAGQGGWNPMIGWGMVDPVAAVTAVLPEEQGVAAPPVGKARLELPPYQEKNWTPMIVALGGAGGGVALLGITLFVVNTMARVRARQQPPTPPARS
ncbi:type VII secretion-associated serine protease [Longimycelium tulufanense]|uniref:Type VII secretion-associated serine protease n=1 Tax=Longimycelium tulufanense TaxID=907463 RepID=A0A8J3FU23_9PSEU|nr:type VII secretion-associated serine protease mycosin [Longimycelium tulufanense]GGM51588.1 type VII secretion-associated serine protease [Longimycelium tulufanense]